MSTTSRPTFLARQAAHIAYERSTIEHVSITEALNAHRLDLGQKLAAAVDTIEVYRGQGRPASWIEAERDAMLGYAAELLAIADLTEAEARVIVALGLRP